MAYVSSDWRDDDQRCRHRDRDNGVENVPVACLVSKRVVLMWVLIDRWAEVLRVFRVW
jgi:hypothetical protein